MSQATVETPLAARTRRIAVSATAAMLHAAAQLRAEGRDLVDLGVGEPDFPTPEHIKQAAVAALNHNQTRYTEIGGLAALRQAIAAAHARDYGSSYPPEQVQVTVGGKHGLFNATQILVDHGDEVIVPAPYWVSFTEQIRYAGGTPVIVATDESQGFTLPVAAIEKALSARTKVILLNSPANPSGAVFPPATFRAILEICRRRGIWLLSDECYAQLSYDAPPYSVAGEPGAAERVIIAGSLSKTYAMTGWRIGYTLSPPAIHKAMNSLQSHTTSNTTTFAQHGAIAALSGTQQPVADMRAAYRQRREVIVKGLNAIPGVRCALPAGAFYAYANVGHFLGGKSPKDSMEFSQRLLREAGVVSVPGEAFGTTEHVRFSYAAAIPVIEEGLRRLQKFCAGLN
ncbi:MAG TPA: pyridoxal phosphate-dependent aminotransferase [Terriglobales bacterium]|nr:pyridoxal phosphate-dependent aminotransferase [Terriglobales bacterium]